MTSNQKFLITALLSILHGILINFFYVKFTKKSTPKSFVEQDASDFQTAKDEINNFANAEISNRKKFANFYTLDMENITAEITRLNNPNVTVYGMRIANGLAEDVTSTGQNKKIIIKLLDRNEEVVQVPEYIVADYRDLCPPKCDISTSEFGKSNQAEKPTMMQANEATKCQSRYYDSSTVVYGTNILYDKIRGFFIAGEVLDFLMQHKNAKLYFGTDANQKREVYIFGADVDANGKAVIITDKFYKIDYRDLCPPKCD
jgi:hypothetical protein